jgi:hypothetical protein
MSRDTASAALYAFQSIHDKSASVCLHDKTAPLPNFILHVGLLSLQVDIAKLASVSTSHIPKKG